MVSETSEEQRVTVYTDGACHGNPGPGGWGVFIQNPAGADDVFLYGGEKATTNNRMELFAAITALEHLVSGSVVQLWTDSKYVMDGITGWISGWKRKGWVTASGTPVKNKDLWQRLDTAAAAHTVEWRWVRGHTGHPGNELADTLATKGAIEYGGSAGPRPARAGSSNGGRRAPGRRRPPYGGRR